MKSKATAKVMLKAAVFYFTLAVLCHNAQAQSEIKFRTLREALIVVPAMVNGAGPFDFILDTGTDTTVVDSDLARRVSLPALDRVEFHTIAGTQTALRSSIVSLTLASASAKNVEALVIDAPELKTLDTRIAGILGQNFLSHFNFLLDYRRHTITLETAYEIRDRISGERTSLEIRDQRVLVPAASEPSGEGKLVLLLDTAATSIVLFHRAGVSLEKESFMFQLRAANGTGSLNAGRLPLLRIGSQIFRDLAVALPPPAVADAQRFEDGLLPTLLFQSVYINNRESFAVFNPRMHADKKSP